ncbi:MAG: RIP metalloprotease RseP, partial [candidate division GAL15 bacterium]
LLGDAAQAGFDSYLFTAAFLSVMIGLFNLLPLPALDGGRLSFLLVEALRRRAVDPRREGYVHLVGFALLLLLVLALTYRDILRWVGDRNF